MSIKAVKIAVLWRPQPICYRYGSIVTGIDFVTAVKSLTRALTTKLVRKLRSILLSTQAAVLWPALPDTKLVSLLVVELTAWQVFSVGTSQIGPAVCTSTTA